jgi:hypothetical protein
LKRTVESHTVAVRSIASDLSGIVATLVGGTVVEQIDASAGWVKIVTEDGRQGWLRETDLGPLTWDTPPTLAEERAELSGELEAVEQSQLGTLITQIEQVAEARQAADDREPVGWQFATDQAVAAIKKNYTFHAFAALFLYTFLWIPGFILNIIWLNQANKDQNQTGKPPEGKGCLVWLIWVFGILPIVTIGLLLAIGIMVAE